MGGMVDVSRPTACAPENGAGGSQSPSQQSDGNFSITVISQLKQQQEALGSILRVGTETRSLLMELKETMERMEGMTEARSPSVMGMQSVPLAQDHCPRTSCGDPPQSLAQRFCVAGSLRAKSPTLVNLDTGILPIASDRDFSPVSGARDRATTSPRDVVPERTGSSETILRLASSHSIYQIDKADDDVVVPPKPSKEEIRLLCGIKRDTPEKSYIINLRGRQMEALTLLDVISTSVVVMHTLFAGAAVTTRMGDVFHGEPETMWVEYLDMSFSGVFFVECVFRYYLLGRRNFFFGQDKLWNFLDVFFAFSAVLDLLIVFMDLSFIRAIRILRVIRAFRALRGMRFVPDLRLMLASILSSAASFVWGFSLFFFVLYVSAISMMQSLVVAKESYPDITISAELYAHYGTVVSSIITLFMAVSGGKDWDDFVQPLLQVHPSYQIFYMGYIFLVLFGLMNILTAVFVENASEIGQVDKDLVIRREIARNESQNKQIKQLFMYANSNRDGTLSVTELEAFLSSPERCAMLSLLQMDVSEARGLFELMDVHETGKVELEAYVDAVLRLRGTAKGCDTALLLFEHKRLMIRLASFMSYTSDSFCWLFKQMNVEAPSLERYFSPEGIAEKEAEVKKQLRTSLAAQLGQRAADIDHRDGPGMSARFFSTASEFIMRSSNRQA